MHNSLATWRFPTADAIASLSSRFNFQQFERMQDVEAELSDPTRIHEFVEAYETAPLTEDERFLLMGIILNSFEFGEIEPAAHPNWDQALALLDRDFGVNRFHVESFSEPGWRIAAFMHALAERKSPSGGSTDAA